MASEVAQTVVPSIEFVPTLRIPRCKGWNEYLAKLFSERVGAIFEYWWNVVPSFSGFDPKKT